MPGAQGQKSKGTLTSESITIVAEKKVIQKYSICYKACNICQQITSLKFVSINILCFILKTTNDQEVINHTHKCNNVVQQYICSWVHCAVAFSVTAVAGFIVFTTRFRLVRCSQFIIGEMNDLNQVAYFLK